MAPFLNGLSLAPLASVFLLLSVFVSTLALPEGLPVVLTSHVTRDTDCGDGRILVAHVARDGVTLNGEPMSHQQLRAALERAYRTRVQRVLYVEGEPDLDYQDVVRFIDWASSEVDYLTISLLTPTASREPCLSVHFPTSPLAPWLKYYKEHGSLPARQ